MLVTKLRSQKRVFIFVVKMEIGYSNNTFVRMNYDSYFNKIKLVLYKKIIKR